MPEVVTWSVPPPTGGEAEYWEWIEELEKPLFPHQKITMCYLELSGYYNGRAHIPMAWIVRRPHPMLNQPPEYYSVVDYEVVGGPYETADEAEKGTRLFTIGRRDWIDVRDM